MAGLWSYFREGNLQDAGEPDGGVKEDILACLGPIHGAPADASALR
jgi:hypothetical protein